MASKDEVVQQIRAAAQRGLSARIEPLATALASAREAVGELEKRLSAVASAIPGDADEVLAAAPVAALLEQLPQPEPAAPAGSGSAFDWRGFKEGIRAIDSARTQVDVLNAFLGAAATVADRVALFVLKGDRIAGWKGRGFADHGGVDDAVKAITMSPADDPSIGRVFADEKSVFAAGGALISRLSGPAPALAAFVPMTIKDKVAAFVYADRVSGSPRETSFDAIEVLTHLTTLSIDTLATRKKVPSPSLTPAAEMPSGDSVPAAPASPPPAPPAPIAVAPAPELPKPSGASISPPSAARISITIPVGGGPGADSLTAPTPRPAPIPAPKPPAPPALEFTPVEPIVEPAPAPAPPPPPPAAPGAEPKGGSFALGPADGKSTQFIPPAHLVKKAPGIGGPPVVPPGMTPEEAKRHDEAKRFARLLVSEIKLYNEPKVNAGRRDGDLYHKLKEDIDRSRQMYDERIPEDIRSKTNYFYDELVRILADGKPDVLGV